MLLAVCACTGTSQPEETSASGDTADSPVQEVFVYRACELGAPGELIALPREVPGDLEPTTAAIRELVRGVNEEERARGCRSFFSSDTENALRAVHHSEEGDTVHVDFRDFSEAIPDVSGAKSFLPPGVMAELTWTIFRQFPGIEAIRFSFDGDERAFWSWVGDEGTEPQVFSRSMWERL